MVIGRQMLGDITVLQKLSRSRCPRLSPLVCCAHLGGFVGVGSTFFFYTYVRKASVETSSVQDQATSC